MTEEVKTPTPDEILDKARKQAELDTAADKEIVDKAAITVETVKQVWMRSFAKLLAAVGNTQENVDAVAECFADLQSHHLAAVYNASQFIDMYQYHLMGQGEFDLGARFAIEDLITGFVNHAPAIPTEMLCIVDKTIQGWNNPLFTKDPLPLEKLEEDMGNLRIPVRVETNNAFITGYYQMFEFIKQVNGQAIKLVTTTPCIRGLENYFPINSVVRWFPITEEKLQQDWRSKEHYRVKKATNTIDKSN